ncbi:hypothetical protein D9757_006668 [Collybiopsis confluens]|uniref:Uncharacterized protein n=1 Tax=Collybiopsis confluens TaxID=2823264 RepID=A0A8H5HN17_9AGAR|nr:hypothetical protein D9757_006668 [Collybiopsis confluens]
MSSPLETSSSSTRSGRLVKAPHRIPHVLTTEEIRSNSRRERASEKSKIAIVDCPPENEGDLPPVPPCSEGRVFDIYDTPDWDRFLTVPFGSEGLTIGDCVEYKNEDAESHDCESRYGCIVEIRAQRWRAGSNSVLQRLREPKNFRLLILTFLTKPLLHSTVEHSLAAKVARKDDSSDRQLFAMSNAAWINPETILGRLNVSRIDPDESPPPSGLFYDRVYCTELTGSDIKNSMIPAISSGHPLWPFKLVHIHNWFGHSREKPSPTLKYWNQKIFERYCNFQKPVQNGEGPHSSPPPSELGYPTSKTGTSKTPSLSFHRENSGVTSLAPTSPSSLRRFPIILGKRSRLEANEASASESDQLVSSDEEQRDAPAKERRKRAPRSLLIPATQKGSKSRSPKKATRLSFSLAMATGRVTHPRPENGEDSRKQHQDINPSIMTIDAPLVSPTTAGNDSNEVQPGQPERKGLLHSDLSPVIANVEHDYSIKPQSTLTTKKKIDDNENGVEARPSTPPSLSSITLFNDGAIGRSGSGVRDAIYSTSSVGLEAAPEGNSITPMDLEMYPQSTLVFQSFDESSRENQIRSPVDVHMGALSDTSPYADHLPDSAVIFPEVKALETMMASYTNLEDTMAEAELAPPSSVNVLDDVHQTPSEPVNHDVGHVSAQHPITPKPILEERTVEGDATQHTHDANSMNQPETTVPHLTNMPSNENHGPETSALQDENRTLNDQNLNLRNVNQTLHNKNETLRFENNSAQEQLSLAFEARDSAIAERDLLKEQNMKVTQLLEQAEKDLAVVILERDTVVKEYDDALKKNRILEEKARKYREYYAAGANLSL